MQNNSKKSAVKLIACILIPIVLIICLWAWLAGSKEPEYTYSDIVNYFRTEQVREFTVDVGSGKLYMKVLDDTASADEAQKDEKDNKDAYGGIFNIFGGPNKKDDDGLKEITYTLASVDLFYNDVNDYILEYNEAHPDAQLEYDYTPAKNYSIWIELIPMILLIVLDCNYEED